MADIHRLLSALQNQFAHKLQSLEYQHQEITIEVAKENSHSLFLQLRDQPEFDFAQLIDVCGVDYAHYGLAHWQTDRATATGFDRGVEQIPAERIHEWSKPRFAVVYHLLSLTHNWRLRVRVFIDESEMSVPSVVDIWAAANWFEREAFDLYGIYFIDHPDLRRILTDYGFIGHPFRKDFPLSGHVEVRYDAHEGRVIYEKVDIEPRVLVPKVIRDDNRYLKTEAERKQEKAHG
ncbi:MAG: NADH-quinone oxidoreductase subunit C [Legionellales bacterium]|nr:NADH-quinone oxidoreductase subunit C [Legionellales bacterium]